MSEQTHPEGGVAQELSSEQRVANLLTQPEGPADEVETKVQASPEQQEQPESPATDETPVEAEQVEQPAVEDAFEIVHNGTQVKLTREEVIAHARQGFDYTQKTQKVAEQERFLQAKLQQLNEVDQVTPHLMQDLAQVKALEAQLNQYQKVDWVQLATDDPMGYPAKRAQFDLLERAYFNARGQMEHRHRQVMEHRQAVTAELLLREEARLPEVVPEWKDEAKKAAGKQAVAKYLTNNGIPPENAARYLDTAFALATAYKAARWDELQKATGDKAKQLRTAPPVTKPGAASNSSAKADKDQQLRQSLKKTGSAQDAMAVILNRLK